MTKKFMYVCLGILALGVAFHLGAQYGNASIVDHLTSGIVANEGPYVLLENGEVWYHNLSGWVAIPAHDAPIPVSDIKFWDPDWLVSDTDELWYWGDPWRNLGSPPSIAGVPGKDHHSVTWSRIKAEFGE